MHVIDELKAGSTATAAATAAATATAAAAATATRPGVKGVYVKVSAIDPGSGIARVSRVVILFVQGDARSSKLDQDWLRLHSVGGDVAYRNQRRRYRGGAAQ